MPQFAFFTCQAGAETALKRELAASLPQWLPSFSRPGFVTIKNNGPDIADTSSLPPSIFARTKSLSLGRVQGDQLRALAEQVWQAVDLAQLPPRRPWLHVWQRDTLVPGDHGFEPAITPLAEQVHAELLATAPPEKFHTTSLAGLNGVVLDVVLVEPDQWYLGWHVATDRLQRWPGGLLPLHGSEAMISRAYLKIAEALRWARLPTNEGDIWAEIGCAPGGASQYLLEQGFYVMGIDPAEVDPWVVDHPHFVHHQKRAAEVPRNEFQGVEWLAADLNVAPRYTLDAVESILASKHAAIRGMVLTLKLADWHLAEPERMKAYIDRVRNWGYRDVRVRQLAHNRQEICLIAMRNRSQRRISRAKRKSSR